MNKEIVKKGFQAAEQELEEKQIEKVKDIVKRTLTRIKDLDERIKELEEDRKILKLDIEDLKDGHLDRIEERQQKDERAKKVSVIEVIKEVHHHHYDWWYTPYVIKYKEYTPWPNQTWCGINHNTFGLINQAALDNFSTLDVSNSTITNGSAFTLTASVAKNNVIGTYDLGNKTVHLR